MIGYKVVLVVLFGAETMSFGIFDCVSTVYGPGYISAVRSDCYVVKLGNWQLADGQSPTLYLQKDALKPILGAFPGATVSTTFGPSRILAIRGDGCHVAKPLHWTLANNSTPTLYLNSDSLDFTFTPGFDKGDEVMTVYGQGYIHEKRDKNILIVKLRDWKLAQGQSPTLFLAPSACVKIPGFRVGACAKTVWGLVRIIRIERDGKHVCEALHWKLANNKPPTLYLAPEAFSLLSIKP